MLSLLSRNTLLRWLPALLWMALITYWSAQSTLPIDHPRVTRLLGNAAHPLAHAVAFAVLGGLVRFALGATARAGLWAWLLAASFGLLDEWHQSFTPGRAVELGDWLMDIGAAAAAVVVAEAFAPKERWTRVPVLGRLRYAPLALTAFLLVGALTLFGAGASLSPGTAARRAAHRIVQVAPAPIEQRLERLARGTLQVAREARDEVRSRLTN